LPCYSDKEFYENVNVLIQLHEMRLSALLRRLFSLLETIARAAQTSDQRQSGLFQQSQLLMLRIYASHGVNSDRALINLSGSSSEESSEDGAAAAVNGRGYNKGEFNLYYPAPLEEPVAKRAFSIASEYFRSWTSPHSARYISPLSASFIQDAAGAIFMFRAKSCLYLVADLTDIRFLEYASMDVTRLAQIIDAFNDVFTRVKPAEQLKLAVVLRRAIWNFISRCAGTFIDMHLTMQRPPTNRIEPFMDNLRAIIDSHTRSNAHPAFYQLMIMLLMLCPDTLVLATEHAFEHGEAREDGCSKHIRCISRIHQYMTNRDELQRTASNNVSRLAEISNQPIEPKLLLMNTMSCIFQLNPEKALQVYLPRVTGPKAEPWMQLIFMYAHYTKSIASLILDLLRRNVDTIQTISEQQRIPGYSFNATKSICDMALNMASTGEKVSIVPPNEIAQRVQMDPRTAIWGENEDSKFESMELIVGAISSCIQEPAAIFSEWVQSADIAFATWTLSLQVIQGICRALVHSMHRQLLEILFDMMLSSGAMGATVEMAEYPQFEVAFEVVLTQECIRLKTRGQQLMVDAGILELDTNDVKQAGHMRPTAVLLMREETARRDNSSVVASNDVKDEKKEQTSRRRNINKLSMRSRSGLTAGSTGSTHGTGSAGLAGRDDNQSVGPLRSAGIIGPGTQLPALRTQWRYCTGFLLAAGGACISDGPLHSLLEHFIGECLKLIVSDDIQLRELAKEGLGNKTHPGIYMLFLDGCLLNMKRFMQPSGEVSVSESRTLFVSQCISIIESLIDRDSSMNIDFSPYLNAASVQIRYTRMVDMFLQSSLRQAIAQEVNLRNDLLETFVNWVTELRAMDPRTLRTEEPHMTKLLTDLTISTMRALIQVLDKLPVKPMNNPGPTSRAYQIQEFSSMTSVHATNTAAAAALDAATGGNTTPANRGRANRSESFVAATTDVGVGRDIARNIYGSSAASTGSSVPPLPNLSQNAELLLNISIKALTNMLAANLEIGLQYSLTIIYHEDTKLRALFTDILGGDTPEHWKSRLLLLGINELCQVQDIDELGAALINIFEARNQTRILFERVITVELERTDSASELFLNLVPAIRKLLAQPPGTLTFELNPNKMTESADRDRNLKNVERLCSLVIDAIVSSVNNLPSTLRWICNLIYRIVITRFPDAGYTAVGGFVFLRFLCPAIVAPDSHGICSQITNSEVRRGLLLCTKITHNLANDILFGNKETYMVPLNKFISENRTRTMNFLSEIAELTDDTESIFDGTAKSIASSTGASSALPVGRPSTEYGGSSEADIEVNTTDSTGVSTKDFVAVQRFIFDHLDRLDTYLAREPMVRLHVQQKPNEKRKSTHARTAAANAASAAALGSVAGNGISPTASAIPVGASGQSETPAGSNGAVTLAKAANAEAATAGEITSTENLFTQVSYIMRQLGPPPAPADKSQPKAAVVAEPVNTTSTTGSEEMFYDILRRDVGRNTDAIAKKAIIYVGGLSREKRPVIYVIARRLQMQYLDMESVMLHTLRILEPLATKGFEVFFDLTQFGPANEVPMQWLRQLKRILPETIINNIQSVYWYNVNTHFRKYVKQGNLNLPPRMARRSVFPHSLSDLHEFLASPQADLPPGTVSLDNESGINISPVSRVSRSHPPLPCVVKVTPEAVQITALRRQEVFSLSTYFNDVYHVTEIADLQLIPNSDFSIMPDPDPETPGKNRGTLHRTASRSSESDRASGTRGKGDEQLVLIRFEGTNASITFSSPKWELLYKAIRSARSRYSNHPNAPAMQERVIRPADVPGTLLNNATLRISAYRMLISVLAFATDLCLPPNPLQLSIKLLSEALLAFTKCAANMKPWILHYMQPWLLCLGQFTHDTVSHPDALSRTQDIIRSLIRLHLKEPTMYMHFKEHLTDIYGALTVETELIADMLATLAGKNPRYNKLVVRLRKLVAQTCTMSVLWPEIAVYMRLLLTTSFSNSNLAEEYLPDVAFVTCMLLKSGPGLIHATLHGIVMHCNGMIIDQTFSFAGNPVRQLKESNDAVGAEGGNGSLLLSSYAQLAQQLAELIQKKTKFNFVTFIASSYTRGALMEFKDELGTNGPALESPREALAGVERVAQIFLRIMENPAFTSGRGNSWRARWTTLVTASTFPRAFVDDDLLYQTLATLRGALASFGETDESLPISVLICLVNMVGNLPPDSSYLASLFWIGHLPLYKVGLSLMSKVIRTLDACGAFLPENGDGFQHFLMSARVAVEKASDQIDDVVGISFRYSFSAALSLLLLRGMEDMSTKDEAYEVILQIIGIVANCRKWQQADTANPDRKFDLILPYLILIIPTASYSITADTKSSLERGGYVRLLEQTHKNDIARKCQSDYILSRAEQEIMILYSLLASKIAWSLAPLIHKLHDVMQQSLLHNGANLADIAHGLTVDAVAATTRKSVSAAVASSNAAAAAAAAAAYSALSPVSPSPVSSSIAGHRISNAPPARNREDSSERTNMLHSAQSQETMNTSFERSMVPAHREYMGRIGFGGMGRVILAELASLVVDQML
ncbi:hypothetical protein BX070DRAFT_226203, partial [Coemansia spiralis]